MYIYSVSSSRDDKCRNAVLYFPIWAPYIQCTAVNGGCKHDSVFFPPLWSRGPARYLMEKYWIWCVAETVHSPVKSFWEDISKGVLNVYPATLSTAHSLCFLETCKTRFLLLSLLLWWCQSSQRWEVISIFKVQVGLRCTSVSEIAQTARKSITSRVVSELHAAHEKRTCYVIVHVMMQYKGNWLHTTYSVMSKLFVLMKSFFLFAYFPCRK